jgi:TonB family protein
MTVQGYQPQINLAPFETAPKQKRLLGILLAVAVLGAIVLVALYYRWFGNAGSSTSNETGVSASDTTAENRGRVSRTSRRTNSGHRAGAVVPLASEAELTSGAGITEATIRSPLAVEVISSSGHHQIIGTRDDSIYLGSNDQTPAASDLVDANAGHGTGVTNAAEQIRLSSGAAELESHPAGSVGPLLAKQETLEGAVVLLAQIDKDGNIQNLRAISGPEIFYAAAREAVKQWRFKPYYQWGQAIDTEAQITVKFAISAH